MTTTPPAGDAEFARWLAQRAGDLLLKLREELGFDDPAALRAAGDKLSHELITQHLARWRPADAVLSEEAADDPARLDADRVWIVDPLDGTREFGEHGRDDWAVHIALFQRSADRALFQRGDQADWYRHGSGLIAGAVGLPAQGVVLATDRPPVRPPEPGARRLRLVCSRTRPPAFLADVAAEIGAELVPMGSAGAKISAVVTGRVDAYVHAGGMYQWDSAAPVAVALATGIHASRIDGTTLEYNRPDLRLPDLVVCHGALAPRLLTAIARCAGE